MSGVVAGSLERKEQLLEEIFVEQCRAKQGVAATSRRHHVATSPRRDVSSKICISSFNVRKAQKLGHREAYDQRH